MGKTRQSANLVSDNNIFIDIENDRVGIGSTIPSYKLDVVGDINFTGSLYQNEEEFVSGGGGGESYWSGTEVGIHTLSNVGVGTTNPQFTLDVTGDINLTGTLNQNGSPFVASRWTAGTGDDIYRLDGDVGIGTTNPTVKLHVIGDANIVGTTTVTSLVETSSITLKENISPIENALDKILQLNPVTYDRKNNISKNEAGLIAEEVVGILPNIVTKDGNGNPEGINYTKLSVYLIDAIKTLKKEIEDLRNGNS
jgi:hypothetical protein